MRFQAKSRPSLVLLDGTNRKRFRFHPLLFFLDLIDIRNELKRRELFPIRFLFFYYYFFFLINSYHLETEFEKFDTIFFSLKTGQNDDDVLMK